MPKRRANGEGNIRKRKDGRWEGRYTAGYDQETGKPLDQSYLECGLPDDLQTSIQEMQKSWAIIDGGSRDPHWDIYWCNLNADINSAEVERIISPEQAWYLREKYLRMERE